MRSVWSIYDNAIYETLPKYGTQWVEAAKAILDGTGRNKSEIEKFADYIRKNKKRFLDEYKGVHDHAEVLDIDLTTVKDGWLKHKKGSFRFINRDFIEPENQTKEIDFLSIFKDKIEPVKITPPQANYNGLFDRLVISDVHIGMDVNKDGFALYDGEWDEAEINKRLEIAVNWTIQYQKSDTLLIHDLGDFMDGFDGYTTRGGHKLPQNMDNQKAFDVGLKFKIRLVDALVNYFKVIECVNITNDNHGGSFSYIVNSAFKTYVEMKYENVKVINQRKFIDHYIYNNYAFIMLHGKDAQHMKHGFKPEIDPKQISMLGEYIDAHKLSGYKVEVDKGDSHRLLINKSIKKFVYTNHPAFSPPSDWVKTNFGDSLSGFIHRNYTARQSSINDYIF